MNSISDLKVNYETSVKSINVLKEKLNEYEKINEVVEKSIKIKSIIANNEEEFESDLSVEKNVLLKAENYLKKKNMYVLLEDENVYEKFKTTILLKRSDCRLLEKKVFEFKNKFERYVNLKDSLDYIKKSHQLNIEK